MHWRKGAKTIARSRIRAMGRTGSQTNHLITPLAYQFITAYYFELFAFFYCLCITASRLRMTASVCICVCVVCDHSFHPMVYFFFCVEWNIIYVIVQCTTCYMIAHSILSCYVFRSERDLACEPCGRMIWNAHFFHLSFRLFRIFIECKWAFKSIQWVFFFYIKVRIHKQC